nr:MAG TPA: hypothetical protein [Inoviridae sp.]
MFIHLMLVWRRREIRAVYTDKKDLLMKFI